MKQVISELQHIRQWARAMLIAHRAAQLVFWTIGIVFALIVFDFFVRIPGTLRLLVLLAGLTTVDALKVDAPLIAECPLNLECRYQQEVELGDYRLVLGEIVEVHAVDDAFASRTSGEVAPFDPLVYLGGIREYWSLGEHAADAYKDGLKLEK